MCSDYYARAVRPKSHYKSLIQLFPHLLRCPCTNILHPTSTWVGFLRATASRPVMRVRDLQEICKINQWSEQVTDHISHCPGASYTTYHQPGAHSFTEYPQKEDWFINVNSTYSSQEACKPTQTWVEMQYFEDQVDFPKYTSKTK